jgi:hypothetical protein
VNPHYAPVAARANHRCEYCLAPEIIFNIPFEIDHIIPLKQGGEDGPNNLALACRACNLWKSDALSAADPTTGMETALYNPRQQAWADHFAVETAAPFRILGQTAVGRATIERLRFNADYQLAARTQWEALGIFPY